jgi:hypothetical protein
MVAITLRRPRVPGALPLFVGVEPAFMEVGVVKFVYEFP